MLVIYRNALYQLYGITEREFFTLRKTNPYKVVWIYNKYHKTQVNLINLTLIGE